MISCKEASRLLSQAQDRRLGWLDRYRLRAHLALCDFCTRFAAQLRFLREAMQRLGD